jgi:outer membrane immunogenic protein
LFDWSGFYLGANIGYGWGTALGVNADGFLGGVQTGYNWLYSNGLLLGAEADATIADISGTAAGVTVRNQYMATLRARLGFAVDRMLFYGTAGWGVASGVVTIAGLSNRQLHGGLVYGLGAEAGITPNLTARVEYLRLDLGSQTYATVVGPMRTDFDTNILRVGMNYKF